MMLSTPRSIRVDICSNGGPLRLGAFHQDEFRGSRLIFSTQGYIHRIGSLPALFGGKIYAGGAVSLKVVPPSPSTNTELGSPIL